MNNLLGQILTFISYIIFWSSRFKKEKKNILLYDSVSRIFAILSFVFLKAYTGIKNTLYVILRNVISSKVINKSKRTKYILFIIMTIILFAIYIFDLSKTSTLFILLCGFINLFAVFMLNEQGIRLAGMIASIFYTGFMFLIKNYVGTVCEIICIIVTLYSFIKYYKMGHLLTKNTK